MNLSSSRERNKGRKKKGKRKRVRKQANFVSDQTTRWEMCQIKDVSNSLTSSSMKRWCPWAFPWIWTDLQVLRTIKYGGRPAPASVGLFFERNGSFLFLPLGALRCYERSPDYSAGDRGHVREHWVPKMCVKKPSWNSQFCRVCRWFQIQLFSECNPTRWEGRIVQLNLFNHRTERGNDKWLLKPLNFRVVRHTTIDKQNRHIWWGEKWYRVKRKQEEKVQANLAKT